MKGGLGHARSIAGWLALGAAVVASFSCDASSSDCSNVGCAAVPVCPGACEATCGCCSCSRGERQCRSGQIFECTGSCRQLVETCSTADACIQLDDLNAVCAETSADCDSVKKAYEAAVASFSSTQRERSVQPGMSALAPGSYPLYDTVCRETTGCEVQLGHCEDGLGGPCWYLAESGEPLDRYAALYRQLGCATPTTCDCVAPDLDISCQDDQAPARCVVR